MTRPRITKSEAMAIAKTKCEALGWPWMEPVVVKMGGTLPPSICGWRHWVVRTNANVHGATAHVLFNVSFDGRHVQQRWIGQPGPSD